MTTLFGSFKSSDSYKRHLLLLDYRDMGWKNSWRIYDWNEWKDKVMENDEKEEELRWNLSGGNSMCVLHNTKIFCSVDMS